MSVKSHHNNPVDRVPTPGLPLKREEVIIPAVLEPSLEAIALRLESIRGVVRAVQIDVVDGGYAPNRTWPYAGGRGQQEEFARIAAQDEGLPAWEDFDFEIDLMVAHPERVVLDWAEAGASRLIIHAHSEGALEAVQKVQERRGGELGVAVGIALMCTDTPETLTPFAGLYDFVQVMGIEKVGFQGQPFDPRALDLLQALREAYPELQLQVDGGVGRDHVRECAEAGATRIAQGSVIFGTEDPVRALKALRELLK